jgi:hypothetical protein
VRAPESQRIEEQPCVNVKKTCRRYGELDSGFR